MLVAQSCPTLRPHGLQPTSLLCPWNFPDKNTGVGCHFLLQGIFPPRDRTWASCAAGGLFTDWATSEATVVVLSSVVQSRLFTTPGLRPARLLCPWGFYRQEYWSGLPCPPPGDLANPRIEPRSPTWPADSLLFKPPGMVFPKFLSGLRSFREKQLSVKDS